MLAIYLVTAILGGGLVLFSALGALGHSADAGGGGFQTDHDVDVGGHDVDLGGHDVDMGGSDIDQGGSNDSSIVLHHGHLSTGNATEASEFWIPFASLRFWTYALGAFGVTGLLLSMFAGTFEPVTFYLALGTGVVTGLVASYTVHWISRHEGQGAVGENDFLGTEGRMLVAVRPNQLGKVRVTIKGDIIDMVAISDSGNEIEVGEEVLVVGLDHDRVRIARKADYLG